MMRLTAIGGLLALFSLVSFFPNRTNAADDLEVARGNLTMSLPEGWTRVDVRSSIIEVELQIPAADGDEETGRLTGMLAGR